MDNNTLRNMVFSFIIPGLGQYFGPDRKNAATLFAGAIILHILVWFFMNNPLGSVLNTAYHAYAAYDVYRNSP